MEYKAFVDGGTLRNGMPNSFSYYSMKIFNSNNKLVFNKEKAPLVNCKTNNLAELEAILQVVQQMVRSKKLDKTGSISIMSDSQLIVYQLNGLYKIRNPKLKTRHAYVHEYLDKFTKRTGRHWKKVFRFIKEERDSIFEKLGH